MPRPVADLATPGGGVACESPLAAMRLQCFYKGPPGSLVKPGDGVVASTCGSAARQPGKMPLV